MKLSKQIELFEKYPDLFAQKDLPPQKTAMCFGICCGNGWFDLIDAMCSRLAKYENIQFVQIKEKFGGLRVYTNTNILQAQGVIDMAETMSFKICQNCGHSMQACEKCSE